MSVRLGNKVIAGNYKSQVISSATTEQEGIVKLATENDITNLNTTKAVTPKLLKDNLDAKQDVISDLDTIRTNASNGASAYTTISGYGDIVTHNADEFANADHTHSQYLTSVAWGDVTGKPSTFTPASHNQASDTISEMTSYVKASSAAAISTTDSLNTAVGKLEYKIDDVDAQLQALTDMLNAAS